MTLLTKKEPITKCPECQFEDGDHSFECPRYNHKNYEDLKRELEIDEYKEHLKDTDD